MKNFDALKQMPLKNFANMVFNIVMQDCKTVEEFAAILDKEIPEKLEGEIKEVLQQMQHPSPN